MGESLYHQLGVDCDAGKATIRRAYRERVKDRHPDVCDEPDAVDEFKRLTAARDVLLDDRARARYDRLGHDAYVAAELEAGLWTVTERESADTDDGTPASNTPSPGHTHETGRRMSRDDWADATTSEVTGAGARGSGSHATKRRHRNRSTGVSTETDPPFDRVRACLWALGPWLVVHAVFLATAAGTAGVLTAATGSVPALSLPLGAWIFGLALFLSALHVVSVLYV